MGTFFVAVLLFVMAGVLLLLGVSWAGVWVVATAMYAERGMAAYTPWLVRGVVAVAAGCAFLACGAVVMRPAVMTVQEVA